jgi:hypothetical protein
VALKGQIIDNPTMGDGNNLFDSSNHSNVGSAGALSETTLAGRAKLDLSSLILKVEKWSLRLMLPFGPMEPESLQKNC